MFSIFKTILFVLLVLIYRISWCSAAKDITFSNGGYRGVTIAVHPDVRESQELLDNLRELLGQASQVLYRATDGRARFVELEVIVPDTWANKDEYESVSGVGHYDRADIRIAPYDLVESDEPYTHQTQGCGQSGHYIQFTDTFVRGLRDKTRDLFGYPEKHLVHEWAHFRYGVFDEYGIDGDPNYPSFYMDNGTIYPTTCVKGIKGRLQDRDGNQCKIYSGGRVDYNCRFVPDPSDTSALASLMFMPHIQSIEKFCQNNTGDPKLEHNPYAPNKHNIMCNYRSTWDVISQHQDFKNQDITTLSDKYYSPAIRFLRVDPKQNTRFALVLDVSGSMNNHSRIERMHRAAIRFVNDLVLDQMRVAIIQFSTDAFIAHTMTAVNTSTRKTLAKAVPKVAEGWTAIGKGLQMALEVIRQDNMGRTRGSTIILITDGEDNQIEPTFNEMIPEVLAANVTIDTIALGNGSDPRLEGLSARSGGKCFYMRDDDNATNNAMETAFMGFVSKQRDIDVQWVTLINREKIIVVDKSVNKRVFIDKELGKNTRFTIYTADMDKLVITFRSPNGQTYRSTQNDPNLTRHPESKYIELKIPDSPSGVWHLTFTRHSNTDRPLAAALTVTSDPRDPRKKPIRVNTYFGTLEVRYPATALIYAEVKRGQNAIINARVVAIVERPGVPTGEPDYELDLYDDGIGPDVTAYDGVYTAAFTQFTENGRYSVSARVKADPYGRTRERTRRGSHYAGSRSKAPTKWRRRAQPAAKNQFSVQDFVVSGEYSRRAQTTPADGSMPVGAEFTRQQDLGAFKLDNYVPGVDTLPPGRVTDLQVISTDEDNRVVELQWTAPGDDSFTGRATKLDLRVSLTPDTLVNSQLFAGAEQIKHGKLMAGNIEPLPEGRTVMKAKFQVPDILTRMASKTNYKTNQHKRQMSFHFAIQATDKAGNQGQVSNIASVHFGYVQPVYDQLIIGTDSRPFETVVLERHVSIQSPVLFYHNRVVLQSLRTDLEVDIPTELGRYTRFTVTSDDIRLLNITLTPPKTNHIISNLANNRVSTGIIYHLSGMRAQFAVPLASEGKWTVSFHKRHRETTIAYLSVSSESRVDEPVKVRAWIDSPYQRNGVTATAVVNAEVTKRFNYIICADVLAIIDRPHGQPVTVRLRDNGLGADKVSNDGLYSAVFTQFNGNGRYGVTARLVPNSRAIVKLGVEYEKIKCN